MSIPIPRAGTIAGRAPQIEVAQPQGAAILTEFGQRMLQTGQRLKAEQRQFQTQKASIDLTRDLGAARLEVEQLGDPTQIGPAWDAKVAEIAGRYITPETDPEVAKALTLTIGELNTRHGLALGEKVINLGRSQQEAAWIEARAAITTEAATADPTTFGALVEMGEAAIDQRVAQGLIDPAQGAAQKEAFRQEVYATRATQLIDTDPVAALDALNGGAFNPLGGEGLTTFKARAQAEIDRRAAAQAKADEAAIAQRNKDLDARLGSIATIAAKGLPATYEALLKDPEAMARPGWAEAMAAVQLRQDMPGIATMTVAQLDAAIAAEAKRPIAEPWEAKRIEVLKARREEVRTKAATDPVGFWSESVPGMVPALPDFDPANPQDFAAGLSARVTWDSHARQSGYTAAPAVFSPEEKTRIKAVLDPAADAAPKVALAEAILAGTQGAPAAVLTALEADPTFRRSVKLLSVTGDRSLVTEVLRGQQKVDLKTTLLPSQRQQTMIFDEITGGTFDDAPALKAELMTAALALYADTARGLDDNEAGTDWTQNEDAVTAYNTAVQRLLGAQPDRDGALTIGGLQEVNGSLVVLPVGVGVTDVEQGWEDLTNRLEGAVPVRNYDGGTSWDWKASPTPDQMIAPFKAASIYGGTPDLGADPADTLGNLTLRRVGETDVYELTYERNGRVYAVPEAGSTRAYRFRLTDLLRGARQ